MGSTEQKAKSKVSVEVMENSVSDVTGPGEEKRDTSKSEQNFLKRVVKQTTKKLVEGTPTTKKGAVAILNELKDPKLLSTMIATSNVAESTPEVGESPGTVDALLAVRQVKNDY